MNRSPRRLVHLGHVEAVGLCFDAPWLDPDERRRRVLAHCSDDATVLELDDAILVRFGAPRRVDADHCDAAPLVAVAGSLLAVPLGDVELRALAPAVPSLVRARGGRVEALPLGDARPVDVSTWIDLDGWIAIAIAPIGPAPRPIRPTVHAADAIETDARAVLGGAVPPPAADRQRLLDALADAERGAPPVAGWLSRLGAWFSGTPRASQPALPAATGVSIGPSRPASPPSPPGPLQRLLHRWIVGSPLAQLIGRRQAAYIDRTLKLFASGDFEAALRHAIPMASMPGAPKPSSLTVPTPRAGLQMQPTRSAAPGSSIHLGEEGFAHMRDVYRNAARELEERGRFEEAAFILFELLGNDDAGIAMLERHGKFELAARMAEGRGMPAGLVIRLWFLAGDPVRAVRAARRSGAFADAIGRLERTHPELAARLRLLWGERLAAAGEFAAAVDAVWPVPEARALASRWLDLAIAWGGPTAARLLPRRLAIAGDDAAQLEPVRAAVLAFVNDDGDDAPALRHALGVAWPSIPAPAGSPARALGRVLARALMLDAAVTGNTGAAIGLLGHLGDGALGFEASTPVPSTPVPPQAVLSAEYAAHERGLQVIHDAVALPRGRFLLALGEAGVRLVDRDGRTLRHYEHPASSLLLADSGSRVITQMRRGTDPRTPWTLGRIDLASGRAEPWCDAHFDRCADDHDGVEWYLAEPDAVACVDAQADGLQVLWRVGQLPGSVLALSRTATRLSFALRLRDRPSIELWTYVLGEGDRRLHSRTLVDLPEDADGVSAVIAADGAMVATMAGDPPRLLARGTSGTVVDTRRHAVIARAEEPEALAWSALSRPGLALVRLAYTSLSPARVVLKLHGTTAAHVHRQGDRRVVCDDLGRVIVLDAADRVVAALLLR